MRLQREGERERRLLNEVKQKYMQTFRHLGKQSDRHTHRHTGMQSGEG